MTFFTFCGVCEKRLVTVEQWSTGLCADHAVSATPAPVVPERDWNAILETIDAVVNQGAQPTRAMKRED